MNKTYVLSGIVVMMVLVALSLGALSYYSTPKTSFGSAIAGTSGVFFAVATSTSETVGTANTQVLATSTARTWARIANTGGNAVTCIYKNGAPAALNNGFIVAASSTFEMNQLSEPVYTGSVNCISDTASAATIYVEANQ